MALVNIHVWKKPCIALFAHTVSIGSVECVVFNVDPGFSLDPLKGEPHSFGGKGGTGSMYKYM